MARKKRKGLTPEGQLTKDVRKLLDRFKIFYWKQFQTLGSKKGVSDIIGIKKVKVSALVAAGIDEVGVFFALELKAPGKIPNDNQTEFLENVCRNKGFALWADNIDTVIKGFSLGKQLV